MYFGLGQVLRLQMDKNTRNILLQLFVQYTREEITQKPHDERKSVHSKVGLFVTIVSRFGQIINAEHTTFNAN